MSSSNKKPKLQKIALLLAGAGLGIALSLSFNAVADKDAGGNPLPVEELRAFSTVFGLIKQSYVEPVEDKKLITEAIKGMVSGLDPHSTYLDAEAFKDMQIQTQGEFGGLGIEVSMEDGLVRVVSPIEDTPAYRAGVKAGDFIAKIDETPVQGMSLNDAVTKMRGKIGSSVTLTMLRKGEGKPIILTLKRAVIKVQSVKSKLAEPGYGYIRVAQFQEHTTENVAQALDALYKENKAPLKGVVLDLRNDPGGLLNGAVGVSAAFLPKDALVVYTEGRTPDSKIKLTASKENYLRQNGREDYFKNTPKEVKNVPLVVLVNGGSASASEIVAGALQDHKRAIVVGTQTFGKASVQTIMPIDNKTALKLTTARYFTPLGRSIQLKGITPDIEVEEAVLNGKEQSAFRIREADLGHRLDNPNDKDAGSKKTASETKTEIKAEIKKLKPASASETAEDNPREIASKNDYQLQQALNILKVQQILQNKNVAAPAK
ncbi:S41 family peptidase [Iodobacter fluviatilis]|uniref:Carboxy-terminal processing protease CtpB n=1 Tax=Iodobacter fluviatilis TaxID=537 RepID=A0A377Q305_9NEIS|nr:S41 family peptidase [Iodobacter fluviatilis]TCU90083.1 carboxyl-terminal processing protease [Iodobacter fluviatilis]STQ89110.1 Carboxy-terminal processing protease CtpB precursor [Iodobacter fluviatilis]